MAISRKAWAPKVSSPPVRIVRMSGPALAESVGVARIGVSRAAGRELDREINVEWIIVLGTNRYPPPRVFCAKSAEELETIGDSFFDSAKECVRV
jgi:hypothetical protein